MARTASPTLTIPDPPLLQARPGLQEGLVAEPSLDVVTALTVYLGLLLLIPSELIIGSVGYAVTPASLVGLFALIWWIASRLVPGLGGASGLQPVRAAVYLLAVSALASYAVAFSRPISDVEFRAADRGLFQVAAAAGLTLLAADGIGDLRRLNVLLRRLVLLTSVVAALGIIQFATGFDVARFLRLPGLVPNGALDFIGRRSDFRRVAGTAAHPIEFGAVLAVVLPLAAHYAFTADRRRWLWWLCLTTTVLAIPMSLSRTPFVGLFGAALVLWPTWPPRRRRRSLLALPLFAVALKAAVPGLLGTIRSLFTNLWSDPSTQGRTEDYALVGRYVARHPVLGQGFRTFLPKRYELLDNQYLLTLMETGVVGLAALVLLLLVPVFILRRARKRSQDPPVRDLAQSLIASMVVLVLAFATFDALSFPMVAGLLFLLIGCCGALWRLVGRNQVPHPEGGCGGTARTGRDLSEDLRPQR
ncbi:MAG: O-antigen ligase family protein [Actinomycetota bacterium]|nr:O-antigen ligase family protein [Actinomycetota bacterium]